jgi:hypothetical protein
MKTDFICPKCKGYLNVGNNVIFSIKNKARPFGIILLSPILGDYKYEVNPSYQILSGEEFEFYCPNCHKLLSISGNDNLVEIIMTENDDNAHSVIFSRKAGEKCTYKISEGRITNYGIDAYKYVDFLSACLVK